MKTGQNCSEEQTNLKAKINEKTTFLNTYFFASELYFDFKDYEKPFKHRGKLLKAFVKSSTQTLELSGSISVEVS